MNALRRESKQPAKITAWPPSARSIGKLLEGAPRARIAFSPPQLARLVKKAPLEPGWIYEAKLDGYRLLALIDSRRRVSFLTRNRNDWSSYFPELGQALAKFPAAECILDCEAVALGESGAPDFQALQNAIKGDALVLLYVFDLLAVAGRDTRQLPLSRRKELLSAIFRGFKSRLILPVAGLEGDPEEIMAEACRMGFEGIMCKRADAAYRSGRGSDWLKVKCGQRQELVIGGFTRLKNGSPELGALLVGYYQEAELRYAGKIGTGYSHATRRELTRRLEKIARAACPFSSRKGTPKGALWVQPRLVCEVEFAEWTREGKLRQPVFKGLRFDKPARQIVRETSEG